METLILCIDIGTTSLKAGLFDGDARPAALSAENLPNPDDTYAARQWFPALCRAVEKTGARSVSALCVSGNGPTVVAESGRTVLWNSPLSEPLPPEIPSAHSLFLPQIAAFRKNYPDDWRAARRLFSGPEYLIYRLTGAAVTILPEERYRGSYWTDGDLARLRIPAEKLPPYVPPAFRAGTLTRDAAEALGLSETAPVFCGGPDFITAMIGTNTLAPGKLCDCAGSSEGINLCADRPVFADGIRTLPSVVPGLWNLAVLNPKSGVLLAARKSALEKLTGAAVSYEALIADSLRGGDSEGRRILSEIAENVGNAVKTLRRTAEQHGLPFPDTMAVAGGQAKNAQWMREKAEAAGIALTVCNCADAELTGDALLALTGLGRYKSFQAAADALVRPSAVYAPGQKEADSVRIYRIPGHCRAVLFDIDSTLYTNPAYAFEQVDVQIRHFAGQRGISPEKARSMISEFRRKWSEENGGRKISLGNALTHFGVSIEESVRMRETLLEPAQFLKRDERMIETILALKKKYTLICVTNNPVLPARKTLEAIGIAGLIPDIIGLDTCGKSKPAREPFLLAARTAGCAPENCLSVGDRYDLDIALPLELGMGGILVSGAEGVYRLPEIL